MANTHPMPIEYAGPIPGHVRAIMAMATSAGLDAGVALDDSEDRDNARDLILRVSGPRDGFLTAGFVDTKFRFPVRRCRYWGRPFKWSDFRRVAGETFEACIEHDAPQAVSQLEDAVELITYADEDRYNHRRGLWGCMAAVERAAGLESGVLERPRSLKRRRDWKGGRQGERNWYVTYYPSGNVLYREWQERPAAAKQRGARYNSVEDFSDSCEQWINNVTRVVVSQISGELEREAFGDCTIRYDRATVAAVSNALEHACQLLQAATPGFVKRKASKVESAKGDAKFQAFLSRLTDPRSKGLKR
jgi:hypothetical protein